MRKFKTGDLVKLVSDGDTAVPMTVAGYTVDLYAEAVKMGSKIDEKLVHCVWRDSNSNPQENDYNEDALLKIDPSM